jgi:hypothetical protein
MSNLKASTKPKNNNFELLPSCINKSTQFIFFGSNLQALAKPKQKKETQT